MKYFNVSMHGLSGRHHPALSGIFTTIEVKKSLFHLKRLIGDLFTYQMKSEQSGGSPNCRLCCDEKPEDPCHILTFCSVYSDIRVRILQEYSYLCLQSESGLKFTDVLSDNETLLSIYTESIKFHLK